MSRPKKQPEPVVVYPRPKKVAGFLVCEQCHRAVPYQGTDEETPVDPWPRHRCGLDVRGFDRFTVEDPFRPALGSPVECSKT